MKIITTQTAIYSFEELSEEAKAKAIENECKSISEYWNADTCLESCYEWLSMLSFYNAKIYYTGFWSQGDGACFVADYAFKKDTVETLTKEFPELHDIAKQLHDLQIKTENSLTATVSQSGRYYHENSMYFNIDTGMQDYDIEEEFKNICKKLAKMIYKYIYECYEYDTSEEQAKENIIANEYEFLINGKLYQG